MGNMVTSQVCPEEDISWEYVVDTYHRCPGDHISWKYVVGTDHRCRGSHRSWGCVVGTDHRCPEEYRSWGYVVVEVTGVVDHICRGGMSWVWVMGVLERT